MSEHQDGKSMEVEARHLNEGMNLIRNDIREMRAELREGLERRPTHSDLGALRELTDKSIELMTQRIQQDKEAHAITLENLRAEQTRLEVQINDIKNDAKNTKEEKDKLQKQVLYGFLGTLGGLVGTNVFQGLIG